MNIIKKPLLHGFLYTYTKTIVSKIRNFHHMAASKFKLGLFDGTNFVGIDKIDNYQRCTNYGVRPITTTFFFGFMGNTHKIDGADAVATADAVESYLDIIEGIYHD